MVVYCLLLLLSLLTTVCVWKGSERDSDANAIANALSKRKTMLKETFILTHNFKWHNLARIAVLLSEAVFGVLAIVMLPDEYKNAGVYHGTYHGIGRMMLGLLMSALMIQIRKLGVTIKKLLESSNQKRQVAPDINTYYEDASEEGKKKAKKQDDSEKIAIMVKLTTRTVVVVILYLCLDIYRSIGNYRHITPPACKSKDLFVRLPSFIQAFAGENARLIHSVIDTLI